MHVLPTSLCDISRDYPSGMRQHALTERSTAGAGTAQPATLNLQEVCLRGFAEDMRLTSILFVFHSSLPLVFVGFAMYQIDVCSGLR